MKLFIIYDGEDKPIKTDSYCICALLTIDEAIHYLKNYIRIGEITSYPITIKEHSTSGIITVKSYKLKENGGFWELVEIPNSVKFIKD